MKFRGKVNDLSEVAVSLSIELSFTEAKELIRQMKKGSNFFTYPILNVCRGLENIIDKLIHAVHDELEKKQK